MRQLKHHEQRLLKKVDFLDVSTTICLFTLPLCPFFREPELILGYDSRLVVETRCVTPGSQGDEAVPHPGPRRLCQIQQAVWELEIVDSSVESVTGSGSV